MVESTYDEIDLDYHEDDTTATAAEDTGVVATDNMVTVDETGYAATESELAADLKEQDYNDAVAAYEVSAPYYPEEHVTTENANGDNDSHVWWPYDCPAPEEDEGDDRD